MPSRISHLITGGNRFHRRALIASLLKDGHGVCVLTRDVAAARKQLPDAVRVVDDLAPVEGIDAVINLAGENLGSVRWTAARQQRFIDSRVDMTRRLVDWMRALSAAPSVMVSGSAIGWYGPRGDEVLDETSTSGNDFSAELCKAWGSGSAAGRNPLASVCVACASAWCWGADAGKPRRRTEKQMLPAVPLRPGWSDGQRPAMDELGASR